MRNLVCCALSWFIAWLFWFIVTSWCFCCWLIIGWVCCFTVGFVRIWCWASSCTCWHCWVGITATLGWMWMSIATGITIGSCWIPDCCRLFAVSGTTSSGWCSWSRTIWAIWMLIGTLAIGPARDLRAGGLWDAAIVALIMIIYESATVYSMITLACAHITCICPTDSCSARPAIYFLSRDFYCLIMIHAAARSIICYATRDLYS